MRPSPVPVSTAADLIDWDVAVRLARAVVPAGPRVPAATRRATVALLRRSIAGALPWAGRISGLPDAARSASATAEILVVDRAGLITASAAWLRELMDGCAAPDGGLGARTLATAQVGAVLGWSSARLLGQVLPRLDARAPAGAPFDAAARPGARPAVGDIRPDARAGAFLSRGSRPGARPAVGDARTGVHAEADSRTGARLLLVAPNVLEIRQRLDLDVLDLPAWVALHEATHLIQLNAAPWLAGHLADQLRVVVGGLVAASRSAAAGGPGPYAGIRSSSCSTDFSERPSGSIWRASPRSWRSSRGTPRRFSTPSIPAGCPRSTGYGLCWTARAARPAAPGRGRARARC